jgi:hypothetical protein
MESDEGDAALDEEEPDVALTTTLTATSTTTTTTKDSVSSDTDNVIVPSVNGLVAQDSIDGFDDYGNMLPTAGGLRKRKHSTIPPHPPEPWANPPNTLPMQPYSFVGMAALDVNQRPVSLMLPQGIAEVDAPVRERVLAQLNLKPKDPKKPLRVASLPQTRLYQDGFEAARQLTVLEADEVSALMRAELQELTNAAQEVVSPDDMLPPRSMAITLLCTGTTSALTPNQKLLLDAAAHLAAEPGSDGEHTDVCASSQVRMSLLHGDMATTYAEAHRKDAYTTNCQCLRMPSIELCITWPQAMPIGESGFHIRSEFVTVAHCDTAEAYAAAIVDATVTLWSDSGVVPGPLRLLGSYAHGAAATDAYARHCIACAHTFWSKVETHHPVELSAYATNDPKYCGALEWTNLWAKIVPRNTPLDGPNVSHGILLHQQGWRDQAREYLKRVKAEENQAGANGAYGLRAPMDSSEIATCPHIMVVNAERLHLGNALSCFGLRGVAGESFGGTLPRLVWRLLPITTALTESVYVLPCHEENVYNAQQVTDWAIRSTNSRASHFYSAFIGQDGPTAPNLPAANPEDRARTEDEQTLALVLGVPLSCKAFRIGDVKNALHTGHPEARRVVPDGLGTFLVAAAAALGTEASIDDAFVWASTNARLLTGLETENARMATQIEELKHTVQTSLVPAPAAAAHAPAARPLSQPSPPSPPPPSPPPPPAAPPAPPPPLEPTRFTNVQRSGLLRRWGRNGDMSGAMFRALNNPIVGVSLKTILATVGDAVKEVDATVQHQAYEWAKVTCCKKKFGDRERVVRLCHHALRAANAGSRRVFLLWADESTNPLTIVYEIDLSRVPEEELVVPIKTKAQLKIDAKDLKSVVVLAWIGAQRALAALLPA